MKPVRIVSSNPDDAFRGPLPEPEPAPNPFQAYSSSELDTIPEPEWLIDGVVPRSEKVLIWGKPGSHKSRVAIHWANITARDHGWVVYVYAEGFRWLKARQRAWEAHHADGNCTQRILFFQRPPQLRNAEHLALFAEAIKTASSELPVLLILDTLARHARGVEENSAKEIGEWWDGADILCSSLGTPTFIALHHSNRAGTGHRGSGALDGEVRASLECTNEDGVIRIHTDKVNDAPNDEIVFRLVDSIFHPTPTVEESSDAPPPPNPLNDQIIQWLDANPNCSADEIRRGISKRKEDVLAALRTLQNTRRVTKTGAKYMRFPSSRNVPGTSQNTEGSQFPTGGTGNRFGNLPDPCPRCGATTGPSYTVDDQTWCCHDCFADEPCSCKYQA